MKEKTVEEWLKSKVLDFKKDPKNTLENMLADTNDVMLQYKKNPKSKASKVLFDNCIECNKLFLIEIGVIDAY